MDHDAKARILETGWLFWAFMLVGFNNGILGPCLPDLEERVHATLDNISLGFFLQGSGFLTGLLIGLLLEKRLDRRLLIGVYVLAGSGVNIFLTLIPNYTYLLVMMSLQGVAKGLTDFGVLSLCNALWDDLRKPLVFQFIVLGAGFATFISPFIAQPFITDSLSSTVFSSLSSFNVSQLGVCPNLVNISVTPTVLAEDTDTDDASEQLDNIIERGRSFRFSDIRMPFIIVGFLTLPPGLAFLYFFFKRSRLADALGSREELVPLPSVAVAENASASETSESEKTRKDTISRLKLFYRFLVFLLNIPIFGLLLTYSNLIMPIGTTSPLCMTSGELIYLSVMLWGMFTLGRVVNMLLLICLSQFLLLLLNSVGLIAAALVLVVLATRNPLALWFGTAGFGFFISPFLPGYMAWSADVVPVSSAFINACLFASGIGEMLFPVVCGHLLAAFGREALMEFVFSVTVALLALFLLTHGIGRKIPGP